MPDEVKEPVVETTTEQTVIETVEKTQDDIDYEAELQDEITKFEQADHNREGYEKRKAKKADTQEAAPVIDIKAQVQEALQEWLPSLREVVVPNTIDAEIAKHTNNPGETALIKWHLEHSVGNTGTLAERVENAKLIANKKKILKTQSELQVALNNRQQLGGTGQGTNSAPSSESKAKSNYLSGDQVADLKKRGWSEAKIARFIELSKKSK